MDMIFRVTGVCLIAAVTALLLKKAVPELALLVTVAAATLSFLWIGSAVHQLMEFLSSLMKTASVQEELFMPLYKTLGIAMTVKIGGGLCRDAGASGLASTLETVGSFCALLVALPLLQSAVDILLELMNG